MTPADTTPDKVRESFYAIRRTDGESIYNDYAWMAVADPEDWQIAKDYAEDTGLDDPVEFEMVRMTVEQVATKSFPELAS